MTNWGAAQPILGMPRPLSSHTGIVDMGRIAGYIDAAFAGIRLLKPVIVGQMPG